MSVRHLEALLAPRSVAVIGVSGREGSVGTVVWRNLCNAGFAGPLWAVDRHGAVIEGRASWTDVAALPGVPDLAVICTPAAAVPGLVDALGRKGTRAVIVLSAGLKEPVKPGGPSISSLWATAPTSISATCSTTWAATPGPAPS
jgi:acetyltransferase